MSCTQTLNLNGQLRGEPNPTPPFFRKTLKLIFLKNFLNVYKIEGPIFIENAEKSIQRIDSLDWFCF